MLDQYQGMGLNVKGVDSKDRFYKILSGISDPEDKRKAIGNKFIDVFDDDSHKQDKGCCCMVSARNNLSRCN